MDIIKCQPLTPMKLRKKVGLTQTQLAQALNVRRATISDWERRVVKPHITLRTVKKMLDIYQCSIDELIEAFEGKDDEGN